MEFARYVEYLEEETRTTYNAFYAKLNSNYVVKCYGELLNYKRSDEFRRLKNQAYWARPKEIIDVEALTQELAKLGYWAPGGRMNNTHISYPEVDAIEDANNARERALLQRFKPSVTDSEYFSREAQKLKAKISDPLLVALADCLAAQNPCWIVPSSFDEYCLNNSINQDVALFSFFEDLKRIMVHYHTKIQSATSLPSRKPPEQMGIVVNGSRVVVEAPQSTKASAFNIDITKYDQHTTILGLKEDECFSLSGIPIEYRIKEIWR